jgi:hypothetical protein
VHLCATLLDSTRHLGACATAARRLALAGAPLLELGLFNRRTSICRLNETKPRQPCSLTHSLFGRCASVCVGLLLLHIAHLWNELRQQLGLHIEAMQRVRGSLEAPAELMAAYGLSEKYGKDTYLQTSSKRTCPAARR